MPPSLYLYIALVAICAALWSFLRARRVERALRRAQMHVEQREKKMHVILNNAPIVFSAVDKNGIFVISEGRGLEKLGRKSNQSVGTSIYEMHKHNPMILEVIGRALKGEQISTTFELNGVAYELFVGPEFSADGAVNGASMLSVDVTDRRKVEAEKARLEISERSAVETSKLKSEFLANMSHEIRTPINGVMGMASLLLDTELQPTQREFAEAIKQSGASLLTVINDILDFSKIESGKLDFEEIDFDIREVLRHAMKNLRFAAEMKNIALRTELDDSLLTWAKGDPGRIRQVINNLVGNAIKFTLNGHVTLRAAAQLNADGSYNMRVEVEDTGIGISEVGMQKLFVAFAQAEASMARRFGGTGLGLSISKQLIEKMGGTLGVSSVDGVGSTFWFELPLRAGVEVVKLKLDGADMSVRLLGIDQGLPRVLVAEDNLINQLITIRMLEKMGCLPTVVRNGIEALSALRTTAYDLCLMDCQMPELDGLSATRQFRDSSTVETFNFGIPIIALTANAMTGDREKCLSAGMDDYVSKPIAYNELNTVVVRWLMTKRKRAS